MKSKRDIALGEMHDDLHVLHFRLGIGFRGGSVCGDI